MKNKLGLAVAIGLAPVLAACDAGPSASEAAGPAANVPPVEVSAADLSRAFQENEAKAMLAYEGKPLLVSGVVKDIDLSLGDAPVIRLKGAGDQYGNYILDSRNGVG